MLTASSRARVATSSRAHTDPHRSPVWLLVCSDSTGSCSSSSPWRSFKPDSFKAINDEGMPMYQRPFMKGKLPDSLNPDQCKALETVLPPKPASQYTDMELDRTRVRRRWRTASMRWRRQQQQAQEVYD